MSEADTPPNRGVSRGALHSAPLAAGFSRCAAIGNMAKKTIQRKFS
jgi:hypothetical protein